MVVAYSETNGMVEKSQKKSQLLLWVSWPRFAPGFVFLGPVFLFGFYSKGSHFFFRILLSENFESIASIFADPPHSSAEVKERVEECLYYPLGLHGLL